MTVINLRFPIGTVVYFLDKNNLRLEPLRGKVIGLDPCPPEKAKRKGPCYIIRPDDGQTSEWREEEEVNVPPDQQANLDTVVIDLKEEP